MVKKQAAQLVAQADVRQDAAGQLLCNLAAGCDEPAVISSAYTCTGCPDAIADIESARGSRQRHRDTHMGNVDSLHRLLEQEGRPPTEIEGAILALARAEIQKAGEDLERLDAAAAARADELHTHPLYACDPHGRKAGLITD